MNDLLRIPVRFLEDSDERGLDTPHLVKRVRKDVWLIRRDDPLLPALVSDAQFYADRWGPDGAPHITRAAKALLKALAAQGVALP